MNKNRNLSCYLIIALPKTALLIDQKYKKMDIPGIKKLSLEINN